MRFAVVVSQFNRDITNGLLRGTQNYLEQNKITLDLKDIFYSPGAFEIPLLAQKLAKTKKYAGIICLGCVIQGETAHFEFISLGATMGLMQAMLNTEVPITFGILTTYDDAQAFHRSAGDADNKGREAAAACLEAAKTLQSIS